MFEIVEAIHKALKVESTFWFVVVIALGAAMVGGFFAWVIDTGYKNSAEYREGHSQAAGGDIQLSITCDHVPLPMAYSGDLWILDTIWFNGLLKSSSPPKKPQGLWPEDGVWGVGYRCTVKNYGTQTAFGVSLSLDVTVLNWVQLGPASWGGGEPKGKHAETVMIPRPLGPQGSDEFSFYVCSYDPDSSLSVRMPSVAWINSDNAPEKREIPVRIASPINPLSVSPKLLLSSPGKAEP